LQGNRTGKLNPLWAKVMENAAAAQLSFDNRLYNMAASRAYYAMFTAGRVLLGEVEGLDLERVRRHATVLRLFSAHFVRKGLCSRELGRAFFRASQLRGTADYDFTPVGRAEAETAIKTMRGFLAFAEKLLSK
jgi:uncharacterized protein (UPF0332 family)